MEKSQEEKKDISFSIDIRKIPLQGLDLAFSASTQERDKLAELFDVPKIHTLSARVHVSKKEDIVKVSGSFSAKITQLSVISLEPFKTQTAGDFELFFTTNKEKTDESPDIDMDEEPIEFLTRPILEFYPILSEQFGLNLDTFPRKEGETFEYRETSEKSASPNPFSVLKGLTKSKKSV